MIERISEILRDAEKNGSVVSVFTNKFCPENCCVGFVAYHDDGVIIKHLTSTGINDGFYWRRVCDIYRLDLDGNYETDLKQLYFLQEQTHDLIEVQENSLITLLKYASENQKIAEICIDETETQENIIGIPEYDSTSNCLKINRTDGLHNENGITFISIDDIVKLSVDAQENRI